MPRWFQTVESLPDEPPFPAARMRELGLRGIHCGSARNVHAGWLNTDQLQLAERDGRRTEPGRLARLDEQIYYVQHDSTKPYPFADESFEWAYAEHFVEHLTLQEATGWLREIRRLLRPGGLVRLSTPSLERYIRAYVDPSDPFRRQIRETLQRTRKFEAEEVPERPGWMVNNIFYGWDHKWIYDFGELEHVLVQAGFDPASVVERSVGESAEPEVAALDIPGRAVESIYVEARRPDS